MGISNSIAYIYASSSVSLRNLVAGRPGYHICIDRIDAHFKGTALWDEVRLEVAKIGEYTDTSGAAIYPNIVWSLTSPTAGQEYWCSDTLGFKIPEGTGLDYFVDFDTAGFCAVRVYYHYEPADYTPFTIDVKQAEPCSLLQKMMGAC